MHHLTIGKTLLFLTIFFKGSYIYTEKTSISTMNAVGLNIKCSCCFLDVVGLNVHKALSV